MRTAERTVKTKFGVYSLAVDVDVGVLLAAAFNAADARVVARGV